MFTSSKPRHDDEGPSDAAEMRSQKLGLCPETPTERAVASHVWFCPAWRWGRYVQDSRLFGAGKEGLIKHEAGKAVSLYVGLVLARASVSSETWFHFTPLWQTGHVLRHEQGGVTVLRQTGMHSALTLIVRYVFLVYLPSPGLISIRWVDN